MTQSTEFDTLIAPYHGQNRDALLPVLWDIQREYGWISPQHVHEISHTLRVPEADIYGVIGFYTLFHDKPTGKRIIRVCTDPVCGLQGADDVLHGVCSRLKIAHGGTTPDGEYTVEHSPCLGMCDHAPSALVSQQGQADVALASVTVDDLLGDDPQGYDNHTGANPAIMLVEHENYASLKNALETLSPEHIIERVEQSGLIGRGGAAFPTGLKWKLTRQAESTPKYIVCNADESEPGTFKDRILMEQYPHLLLEGIALAAYAIGAETAYIFIRGEYPKSAQIIRQAIHEAHQQGALGEHILGSDFSLSIEVRIGAGAYICGEETALFEAIEGKRGFPRIKPPYPTTHGLFNKPTTVNNVETLCAIPAIIQNGADWFKRIGTEKSSGTKLVSIAGHVKRAGVYEIEPGITLRQLIDDFCGGMDGELQAVLMGGAAGTFLTPDEIDVRLTFEDLRAIGGTLGSGAIMVFNQTTDMRDVLKRLGRFFQHESCGKCFPCQLGTQRQVEILERLDQPISGDKQRLLDIGMTMTEASICGLGQTAGSAVMSAIKKFPHWFE